MSAILPAPKRLTTSQNFYKVPLVQAWGIPHLIPAAHSGGASSVSSTAASTYRNIERDEPCFITKSSCYTHERAHWINAVRNDPELKHKVENLLINRRIVYPNFVLNSAVNLSNLDRFLHATLDKYAFFAVTGSIDTLKELIDMLERDNERRQLQFDSNGLDPIRYLNFKAPAFANPQYELVALRPNHMLPDGKVLVAYSRDANGLVSFKNYVPGQDHTLRESPGDLSSPRFPSFPFGFQRPDYTNLNPFLVILNAEIKFRRYLRQQQPPPLPLPADVMNLIHLTITLVELIYWDPIVRPNTAAAQILLSSYPILAPGPQPSSAELGYIDEFGGKEEKEVPTLRAPHGVIRRPAASAALKERMAYGQYLLSGRDPVFDDDEDPVVEVPQNYKDTLAHTQNDWAHIEKVRAWQNTVEV